MADDPTGPAVVNLLLVLGDNKYWLGRHLSEEQRARWAALLYQSALEAGLPNDPEFQSLFHAYIEWGSRLAVENSQTDARPPANLPMPYWTWNTAAGPPGSRVSASATTEEVEEMADAIPGPDEPVSFEAHIKPLFREKDRSSMVIIGQVTMPPFSPLPLDGPSLF